MEPRIALLDSAVAAWDARGWPRLHGMMVSGSGLAVDLFPPVVGPRPLQELLPFEVHGIEGHPHRFEILEPVPGRFVLYLRGRLHSYQGYDAFETVFPIRLAVLLGAKVLMMTNAAGGLDPAYVPGDLVVIQDHLNLTGMNPLRGSWPAAWGPRFPDLSNAYDARLRALAQAHAQRLGLGRLHEGVYTGLAGPSYETPAEVRMFRTLGGQLAGMSTVMEVITAHTMGARCFAMSLVTNLAVGVSPDPLDHEEVLTAGKAAEPKVTALLKAMLADAGLVGG